MQDNRLQDIEEVEDQYGDVDDNWDEEEQQEEEENFVDENNTEYEFDLNNPFWKLYLETKPRGNSESWAEDIGLPPSVLVDAWGFCVEDEEFERTFHPIDLLRLCSWLRKHSTYRSSAAEWNTSKTTFKRRAWMLLVAFDKIFGQLHSREDFAERWVRGFVNVTENQTFRYATVSVDGIHCNIQGSQNNAKQRSLYSFKAGTTTVKYQLATQIDSGWITDVTGPFVGSVHDYSILITSGLLDWLIPGEKIVCDAGYVGWETEQLILQPIVNPTTPEERLWNNTIAQVRIQVERINSYVKKFRIMRMTYIKSIVLHGLAMRFICHMTNLRLLKYPSRASVHPTLFDCTLQKP